MRKNLKFALLWDGYDGEGYEATNYVLGESIGYFNHAMLIQLFIARKEKGLNPRFYSLVPVDQAVIDEEIKKYQDQERADQIKQKQEKIERLKKEIESL